MTGVNKKTLMLSHLLNIVFLRYNDDSLTFSSANYFVSAHLAFRLTRVLRCGTRCCLWVSWTVRSRPTTGSTSWRTTNTWCRCPRPSPKFWSRVRLLSDLSCNYTHLWKKKTTSDHQESKQKVIKSHRSVTTNIISVLFYTYNFTVTAVNVGNRIFSKITI